MPELYEFLVDPPALIGVHRLEFRERFVGQLLLFIEHALKIRTGPDMFFYHVPGESRILVRTWRHQFHLVGGSVTACEHVFFAGHVAA